MSSLPPPDPPAGPLPPGPADHVRLALTAGRVGLWTLDWAAGTHTRDAALNSLLGLPPAETTAPFDDFVARAHPDDRPHLREAFARAARDRTPLNVEFRVVWPDGTVRWLRDQGDAVGGADGPVLAGVLVDVTDRRAAEDAHRLIEERFRRILDSATDYAVLTLAPDRTVTGWSPGAEAVFGYAADEILGRPGDVLFAPEDRAAGAPQKEADTARRAGRAADERFHVRKGGARFYASGVLTPLGEGGADGFVKVARDLTDRKRMEDDLRAARDRLEETVAALEEANRRKDEFLATLAHELRNPLAPIRSAVAVLQMGPPAGEAGKFLGMIERQASHLTRLVDDLLDVSRLSRGKVTLRPEPVDLRAVAREAVETARPAVDAHGHELVG